MQTSFADSDLPAERHCAVFDTAIGPCGLAWRGEALTHVMLPLLDREATLEELRWQSNSEVAPPPWPQFVTRVVAALQALLAGTLPEDDEGDEASALATESGAEVGTHAPLGALQEAPLDWAGIGEFERKVYDATRRIALGRTCTYDELARAMNQPGSARAVDVALARNPWPLVVPCHRVVAGHGKLGTYSAPGGVATKRRLLDIEATMVGETKRAPR